jgi:hypothetical protein
MTMKKWKNLIGSVVFLGGLAGMLLLLSVILIPQGDVYNAVTVESKREALLKEEKDTIDVIVVGDSETYSAYSPLQIFKEHGFTSYICGTSAQRLCDTVSILETAFEEQSPELIVLETNCFYRYAGPNQNADNNVLNDFAKVFPVFKHHNRWKQYVGVAGTSHTEIECIRKGFKLRTNTVPYEGGPWMKETEKRKDFSGLVDEYLLQIYELCEQNGAELVLVTTPAPTNWTYAKHNAVSDWAMKYEVKYLDMNFNHEEIGIDWTNDTRDGGNHLNYNGAKKVSAYFGEYLATEFELNDYREKENYLSWYEAIEKSGLGI